MDLLNDYLKKIQSGEATVEELASKYDNRIKTTTAAATAPTGAATTSSSTTAKRENVASRSDHKIDGQEENLGNEEFITPFESNWIMLIKTTLTRNVNTSALWFIFFLSYLF